MAATVVSVFLTFFFLHSCLHAILHKSPTSNKASSIASRFLYPVLICFRVFFFVFPLSVSFSGMWLDGRATVAYLTSLLFLLSISLSWFGFQSLCGFFCCWSYPSSLIPYPIATLFFFLQHCIASILICCAHIIWLLSIGGIELGTWCRLATVCLIFILYLFLSSLLYYYCCCWCCSCCTWTALLSPKKYI